MDLDVGLGIAILRAALAVLLFGHSWQKLFGWFRGQGIAGTTLMFEKWGLRPGVVFVVVAALAESVGAGLLLVGAATPLAGAIVIGAMSVAVAFNVERGLWAHLGGYEVALTYAVIAAVLVVTGPGQFSVDAAFGLHSWHGPLWALGAVAAGLIGAAGTLLWRRRGLHAPRAESESSR